MKRLGALAVLLVIAVACDAPGGTVEVQGTVYVITNATATPTAISTASPLPTIPTEPTATPATTRGTVTGGRVVDFLAPTQALIVRENAVSVRVPRQAVEAKLSVLYMRKVGEWTGTGNAEFLAEDLPAGPLAVQTTGASNVVITWGTNTVYLVKATTGPITEHDLYRDAETVRFSVLAPAGQAWTVMVAVPVVEATPQPPP